MHISNKQRLRFLETGSPISVYKLVRLFPWKRIERPMTGGCFDHRRRKMALPATPQQIDEAKGVLDIAISMTSLKEDGCRYEYECARSNNKQRQAKDWIYFDRKSHNSKHLV